MSPIPSILALVCLSPARAAPPDEWDGMRSRIASAGDVNCDGTPDLLLARRESGMEVVWVLCGRDGAVLCSARGESSGDGFGRALSGVGDVDQDGHDDFIVGAQRLQVDGNVCTESGYARVHSGRDGALIHRLTSGIADDSFGACVAGGRDVDGDGCGDVVVTSRSTLSDSYAYVYSGSGGELLARIPGGPGAISVAMCADEDGDRRAEVLVGRDPGLAYGTVEVRLGVERELAVLRTSFADCQHPAWAMSADGDADGDGSLDVLVARIHCGVDVFSGRSRGLLRSIAYDMQDITGAASSLDWLGDIDGDGCDDFVVAANESEWGEACTADMGFACVYSGRTAAVLRTYQAGRKRMDACRAGDADLDGIPDLAVFVEEDRVLRVLAGRDLGTAWEVRVDELPR